MTYRYVRSARRCYNCLSDRPTKASECKMPQLCKKCPPTDRIHHPALCTKYEWQPEAQKKILMADKGKTEKKKIDYKNDFLSKKVTPKPKANGKDLKNKPKPSNYNDRFKGSKRENITAALALAEEFRQQPSDEGEEEESHYDSIIEDEGSD